MEWITFNNVISILTILTVMFGVYSYFKNPQIKSDKIESLFSERMDRFNSDLINLRDNHIHTLDTKIDETNKCVGSLSIEITKLATIIEERIPRKSI